MKRAWAFLSVVPLLMGAIPIIGWVTGMPELLAFNAQYLPLTPPVATCFLLASLALFSIAKPVRFSDWLQVMTGLIVLSIVILVFGHNKLGQLLHIEKFFAAFSRPDITMAPNTAISLALTGLSLILLPFINRKFINVLVEIFIFVLLLLSLLAFFGYVIQIELLYNWFGDIGMMFPSTVGFICIAIVLSAGWRNKRWLGEMYKGDEDQRIILLSSIILFVMVLIVTMANFAELFKQETASVGQTLMQLEKSRSAFFQNEVNRSIEEMNALRNDALFQQSLIKYEKNFQSADSFSVHDNEQITTPSTPEDFNPVLGLFIAEGFSAVAIYNTDQKPIASLGQFNQKADLNIKEKQDYGFLNILWNKNWFTQIASDISVNDKKSGLLVIEWPMPNLDKILSAEEMPGKTGDILVCIPSLEVDKAVCYSARQNSLMTISQKIQDKFMPVHNALNGNTGLQQIYNDNSRHVLMAYGPIGKLHMAILVTMDIAEIYQPILKSLYTFIPVVVWAAWVEWAV